MSTTTNTSGRLKRCWQWKECHSLVHNVPFTIGEPDSTVPRFCGDGSEPMQVNFWVAYRKVDGCTRYVYPEDVRERDFIKLSDEDSKQVIQAVRNVTGYFNVPMVTDEMWVKKTKKTFTVHNIDDPSKDREKTVYTNPWPSMRGEWFDETIQTSGTWIHDNIRPQNAVPNPLVGIGHAVVIDQCIIVNDGSIYESMKEAMALEIDKRLLYGYTPSPVQVEGIRNIWKPKPFINIDPEKM